MRKWARFNRTSSMFFLEPPALHRAKKKKKNLRMNHRTLLQRPGKSKKKIRSVLKRGEVDTFRML